MSGQANMVLTLFRAYDKVTKRSIDVTYKVTSEYLLLQYCW